MSFEKNEDVNTMLSETNFRLALIERIKYFHSISKLRDVSVDSFGFIHCSPSGMTNEKGVHVVAKLTYKSLKNDENVISIKYKITNTQKYIIKTMIIFNFIFFSSLLGLYFFNKFSINSFFFKLLIGLPILLILTFYFLKFSFNQQVNKISLLLNSVVKNE